MLEPAIVIAGGDFGRTPAVEVAGLVDVRNGPDHNHHGFSMVAAGGGFKGGMTYGATGEFGFRAFGKPVHPHDPHAAVPHSPGLEHTRLTCRCSGRDFRLTGVAGSLVRDIIPRSAAWASNAIPPCSRPSSASRSPSSRGRPSGTPPSRR